MDATYCIQFNKLCVHWQQPASDLFIWDVTYLSKLSPDQDALWQWVLESFSTKWSCIQFTLLCSCQHTEQYTMTQDLCRSFTLPSVYEPPFTSDEHDHPRWCWVKAHDNGLVRTLQWIIHQELHSKQHKQIPCISKHTGRISCTRGSIWQGSGCTLLSRSVADSSWVDDVGLLDQQWEMRQVPAPQLPSFANCAAVTIGHKH